MADTKDIDISKVRFSSTVFPTRVDMELWERLSPEAKRAVVERDLDDAEKSGIAPPETAVEIIDRVRRSNDG